MSLGVAQGAPEREQQEQRDEERERDRRVAPLPLHPGTFQIELKAAGQRAAVP
jgi:hypothetical protein